MANIVQTQSQQTSVTISGASSVKVTNLNITSTGAEFSHSLVSGLRQLMVRSRVGATLQFCWTTGETSTNYITIERNAVLSLDNLSFTGKVLYLEADTTGVVEIQELY